MKKNIPVLYLDNSFTFGGAINSLLYMLRALDKEKFEPVLVTGQPETYLHEKFYFMRWYHVPLRLPWVHNRLYHKIIRLSPFRSGLLHVLVNKVRLFYWLMLITLPEAFYYYRIGKKHHVRIVHLNNILGSQLSGLLAAKFLGVPCVAHLRKFEKVGRATQYYAKLVDHHIAISGAIRQNIVELGVPESKITTIFDAIDLSDFDINISCEYLKKEFDIADDTPSFGIFGRIIEWKGIKEFVHAAALVCKKMPNVRAFIIGDISDGDRTYYDEVVSLIAGYGLKKKITLTGYRNDVPAFMKMLDVVVHASTTPEPFGMVLIEAMAMAKPVISTKNGGPLDIVEDQETGFFVNPGDSRAMAKIIEILLINDKFAHNVGRKAQNRVRKIFSKERCANEIEAVYGKILGAG